MNYWFKSSLLVGYNTIIYSSLLVIFEKYRCFLESKSYNIGDILKRRQKYKLK